VTSAIERACDGTGTRKVLDGSSIGISALMTPRPVKQPVKRGAPSSSRRGTVAHASPGGQSLTCPHIWVQRPSEQMPIWQRSSALHSAPIGRPARWSWQVPARLPSLLPSSPSRWQAWPGPHSISR
jgi:hypothetical protein